MKSENFGKFHVPYEMSKKLQSRLFKHGCAEMSAALGARMGAWMSLGRRPFALHLLSPSNAYCCQPRFRFYITFRSVRHSRLG